MLRASAPQGRKKSAAPGFPGPTTVSSARLRPEPKRCRSIYLVMEGHLNRKQFNRCVWCATLMLVGTAVAILGTIGYFAK
jgi:hypothetical protein